MKISPELLQKYAQGTCTSEERKIVEDWLASEGTFEDTTYDALFAARKEIIREKLNARLQKMSSKDLIKPGKDAQSAKVIDFRAKSKRYRQYWVAAAAIVLFAVSFSLYYFSSSINFINTVQVADDYQAIQTQRGEKRTVTLSDGSTVRMNYETEIRVPKQFKGGERIIYLTGHAHFEVVRNTERPFIIYTADSKTQVLGTSFDINTKEKETEIIVSSGKVVFSEKAQENNQVTLTVNDRAVLGADKSIATDQVNAGELTAWKDNRLIIDHKTLAEVIQILEPWFDISIEVRDPSLLDAIYKFSFDNPPLTTLLLEMSYIGQFQYDIDGKQVILY
ncbi:MAG: FecR domain-containing protein [Bacteroidota bacterium]